MLVDGELHVDIARLRRDLGDLADRHAQHRNNIRFVKPGGIVELGGQRDVVQLRLHVVRTRTDNRRGHQGEGRDDGDGFAFSGTLAATHLQSLKYWIMPNCLARPLIAHIQESTASPLGALSSMALPVPVALVTPRNVTGVICKMLRNRSSC
ncbi:Uncharacterised protein [Mycobacteroides abscessus subsp. abscessus]|nr:Uncharacterised protein [Mycobacteroides abscessus subsp. abscessus]